MHAYQMSIYVQLSLTYMSSLHVHMPRMMVDTDLNPNPNPCMPSTLLVICNCIRARAYDTGWEATYDKSNPGPAAYYPNLMASSNHKFPKNCTIKGKGGAERKEATKGFRCRLIYDKRTGQEDTVEPHPTTCVCVYEGIKMQRSLFHMHESATMLYPFMPLCKCDFSIPLVMRAYMYVRCFT